MINPCHSGETEFASRISALNNSADAPFFPRDILKLPPVPGGWTVERLDWSDGGPERLVSVARPALPDAFLDDPEVQEANRRTDYMPYWSYLWPASHAFARWIRTRPWPLGTEVLELGAGFGLVGLAALVSGYRVTFNDYDPTAVQTALFNAEQNGFSAAASGAAFDWRQPELRPFPVIIGCEVIYEVRNHGPILHVLDHLLAPGGECWIADPGRQYAPGFVQLARSRGWGVHVCDESGRTLTGEDEPPDLPMAKFRLLAVRRRAAR